MPALDYSHEVIAGLQVTGLHFWEKAPDHRRYLRHPHRHDFTIRGFCPVFHGNREVEFHDLQGEMEKALAQTFGQEWSGDSLIYQFGQSSCEHIATAILEKLPKLSRVEVFEDDRAGSVSVRRKKRPQIVTLCGSTRFQEETLEVDSRLTLEGHMVLRVGSFMHAEGIAFDPSVKEKLDQLHRSKIAASDWIYVINVGWLHRGIDPAERLSMLKSRGMPVVYHENK